MAKKIYKIPVCWEVYDKVKVKAESLEEAVKYVEDNLNEIPLGTDPEYVEDSYQIDGSDDYKGKELVEYIREFYNMED